MGATKKGRTMSESLKRDIIIAVIITVGFVALIWLVATDKAAARDHEYQMRQLECNVEKTQ